METVSLHTWISTPRGRYYLTLPYLQGARAARKIQAAIPLKLYGPGPAYAQATYGYQNERAGFHDHLPDSFDELLSKSSTPD